jgi:hypothetical protein
MFRSGRKRLRIYQSAMEKASSSGRNRLQIFLSDKEQGVQEWKEQAGDPSECQGTGRAGVEGRVCGST